MKTNYYYNPLVRRVKIGTYPNGTQLSFYECDLMKGKNVVKTFCGGTWKSVLNAVRHQVTMLNQGICKI